MKYENLDELLEVGVWIGRRQTFGAIAGSCSAAEVKCLREMRDAKKYRTFGLTWDEFCPKHVGISRALADKMIRQLEEHGETYFQLAAVTRITPEDYRLIAGAVSEKGLEHGSEVIPIEPDNAARLTEAVAELRNRAKAAPVAPPRRPPASLGKAEKLIESAMAEVEALMIVRLEPGDRARLQTLVGTTRRRISLLDDRFRI